MKDLDPTEKWRLNHSQEKLKANDCDFLDSTELKGIIKTAEFAMLLFTRNQAPKEIFNAAADLNEAAQKFQKSGAPENLGELFEMQANIRQLETLPQFSEERKRYIEILIQRLHAFLDSQICCVSEQDCSKFSAIKNLLEECRIKDATKVLCSDPSYQDFIRMYPAGKTWAETYRKACQKGQKLLQSKAFRDDLKSLRTFTQNDPQNYEFSFTGNSKLKDKRTGDIQRGGVHENGIKHSNVQYNAGDDFACHSHPKDYALSLNGIDGGDFPHVASTQKNLCVITPTGDIYFTTPQWLSLSPLELSKSQVYLGNIEDFDK